MVELKFLGICALNYIYEKKTCRKNNNYFMFGLFLKYAALLNFIIYSKHESVFNNCKCKALKLHDIFS